MVRLIIQETHAIPTDSQIALSIADFLVVVVNYTDAGIHHGSTEIDHVLCDIDQGYGGPTGHFCETVDIVKLGLVERITIFPDDANWRKRLSSENDDSQLRRWAAQVSARYFSIELEE